MAGERILSSLPLQILLYFNSIFTVLYFILNVFIFIYKGQNFLYPSGVLSWEVTFLFLYLFIELTRLFQASKGNKIEQVGPLVWSFAIGITVFIFHFYYLRGQTYVLRVDKILNVAGLLFVSLESVLEIFTGFTFYRDNKF